MTHVARWHEFAYEQTDIPAGMTVGDWRTQRARTRPTSRRWSQIIGALRGGHGGDAARSRATDAPPEPVPRRTTEPAPKPCLLPA